MAYATIADVRAEGIAVATAADAIVQARLDLAHELIHRKTRMKFEPTTATHTVDGTGFDVLPLPMPLVEITSITIEQQVLSADELAHVFNLSLLTDLEDRRRNPKLLRKGARWTKGQRNILIEGSWGFVEADGDTPPLEIKRLAVDLAIWALDLQGDLAARRDRREFTFATQQSTHNRSVTMSNLLASSGPTGDRDVDRMLARYRPPVRPRILRSRP